MCGHCFTMKGKYFCPSLQNPSLCQCEQCLNDFKSSQLPISEVVCESTVVGSLGRFVGTVDDVAAVVTVVDNFVDVVGIVDVDSIFLVVGVVVFAVVVVIAGVVFVVVVVVFVDDVSIPCIGSNMFPENPMDSGPPKVYGISVEKIILCNPR